MALARSASGPGGLTINTGSANSLFGSSSANTTTAAPAAGSLFGAASAQPTTTTAATPSLFGSNTASNAAAATPAPAQSTPSLFGGASTQQTGAGGLFGNKPVTAQPQPATGGSLFGANTAAPAQTQQSGGLFGANPSTATQPQQGTSLFGSTLAKPTPPAATATSSLFGAAPAQPVTTQQPQQPAMGLGASLLSSTNQQQTVPGVRIDMSNVKGTTRFTDLTDELQKLLEQVDKGILHQIDFHRQVDAFMAGHGPMLDDIPNDVKFVARKYDGVRSALETDAQAIEVARGLVKEDADHARLSFRAIDNLKLPQQYHAPNLWAPRSTASATANNESDGQDLITFFSSTADEMEKQLQKYQQNLSEIESHLHGVQHGLVEQLQKLMAAKNGAPNGVDDRIQDLVAVLRDFEHSILQVAGQVGGAREGMTRLQLGDFMGGANGSNGSDY